MPSALGDMLDAIQAGLSQLPPPVLVIGLLFGPTVAWIIIRLFAGPRSTRAESEPADLFWICPECKSANEVGRRRCYLCEMERDAIPGALRVVHRDQVVEIDEADPGGVPAEVVGPGVPVGPGRPTPVTASSQSRRTAGSSGTVVPIDEASKRRKATRAKRPPVAIPIEPLLDDDDDVVAASQLVDARSRRPRRTRRTSDPSEEDAAG